MANKYKIRGNLLNRIRFLKRRILLHETELVEIMNQDYKDKFVKMERVNAIKCKLLRLRRLVANIAERVDRLKD